VQSRSEVLECGSASAHDVRMQKAEESQPATVTLETLVEAIIPTDDRSPGAKQARVADYIDLLLSEADPAKPA
jgi:gluconate 2-dehydrogenase subunit 3-like protein